MEETYKELPIDLKIRLTLAYYREVIGAYVKKMWKHIIDYVTEHKGEIMFLVLSLVSWQINHLIFIYYATEVTAAGATYMALDVATLPIWLQFIYYLNLAFFWAKVVMLFVYGLNKVFIAGEYVWNFIDEMWKPDVDVDALEKRGAEVCTKAYAYVKTKKNILRDKITF